MSKEIRGIDKAAVALNPFVATSKRSKDYLLGFQAAWAELEEQQKRADNLITVHLEQIYGRELLSKA